MKLIELNINASLQAIGGSMKDPGAFLTAIIILLSGLFVQGQVGDNCANPINITSIPFTSGRVNTCDFNADYNSSDQCYTGGGFDGRDVVFRYVPPLNDTIDITLFNFFCTDPNDDICVDAGKGPSQLSLSITRGCPDNSSSCSRVEARLNGGPSIAYGWPPLILTGGIEYYIVVSSVNNGPNDCNEFALILQQYPVPSGNTNPTPPRPANPYTGCNSPESIATLPYTRNDLTTCGQINNYNGNKQCFNDRFFGGRDYLLEYTPVADECVQIKVNYLPDSKGQTEKGHYRAGIALLEGCDPDTARCIAYSENVQDNSAPDEKFDLNLNKMELDSGKTYYIVVSSGSPPGTTYDKDCFPFDITIQQSQCPYPELVLAGDIVDCGDNIGFEDGNLTNWDGNWYNSARRIWVEPWEQDQDIEPYQNGQFLTNNTGLNTGTDPTNYGQCGDDQGRINRIDPSESGPRHTVTFGNSFDPNTDGRVPVVAPKGGNYSVRLGNQEAGWGDECMWSTFTVTDNNKFLTFMYAVVLQDPPGHRDYNKPRFVLTITDQNGNIISCGGKYEVVSVDAANEFTLASQSCGSSVYYQDWREVGNDLSNYLGQNLTLKLCTADCGLGGHFGYAYFDTYCRKIEPDTFAVCVPPGGGIELGATSTSNEYTWYKGDTATGVVVGNNPKYKAINVQEGDLYTLKFKSLNGCASFTEVHILTTTTAITLTADNHVFCGSGPSEYLNYTLTGQVGSGAIIEWVSNPPGFASNELRPQIPFPDQPTTYTVNINYPTGECSYTGSFEVDTSSGIEVDFEFIQECTAQGFEYKFTTVGNYNYVSWNWDFGDGSTSTEASPTHLFTSPDEFTVTLQVTDSAGCTATATHTVQADSSCDFEVWFPNAFTPDITGNGPSPNNRARVRGRGITGLELRIFDRWGELVYHTTDIEEAMKVGWGGKFKDKRVDVDSYAWYLTVKTDCCKREDKNTMFIKGSLTLLR